LFHRLEVALALKRFETQKLRALSINWGFPVSTLVKWIVGILGSITGAAVLVISSFFLSVSFNPLLVEVDFGKHMKWYGVFGQFGDTPHTTVVSTEEVDVVRYANLDMLLGFTKKTSNDAAGKNGRWKLMGFDVGGYRVTAYKHIEGSNSRVGVYFLRSINTNEINGHHGAEIFVGKIVQQDSSGVVAVCPYVMTDEYQSIDEIAEFYPAIRTPCGDADKIKF
jgi:hypothetical protein